MKIWKKITALFLSVSLFVILTSCKSIDVNEYIIPEDLSTISIKNISENDNYRLEWDDDKKCAFLCNKRTEYIWSTTPYGAYQEENTSLALNSALMIEYYDFSDGSLQTDMSYTCVEEGTVESKQIENGVCITYYFSMSEVTIPVYYTLENDSFNITVKAKEIIESGKTRLIAISFAPYLCSVENIQNKESYLLVPTGSGALMYTDNEYTKGERAYRGEVYGTDASRTCLDVTENEETVNCPVFGAKAANGNALFAVINQGAESARIDAISGNVRYGYSNVYATFYVRGFDEIEQTSSDWLGLSENWSSKAVYSVNYYSLIGDDANYNGMAIFYRNYLEKNGSLIKSNSEQKALQLELVGGFLAKKFFLGIPYNSVEKLTTFGEALKIIKEVGIKDDTSVLLKGFGSTGIDVGQVAGGYKFANILGGQKGHAKVEKFCNENGIDLFTDFELIYFNKSGKGFSTALDTAKSAILRRASSYPIKINTRMPDEGAKKVNLLKRSLQEKAVDKLIDFSEDFDGISLGKLAMTAYSDYSNEETYVKNATEKQVAGLINKSKNANKKVMLRAANAYAAGISDGITRVALNNGGYSAFDEVIPFYQMVFRGYVPLYSTPLNYSDSPDLLLLKAVEFGVSPTWLVIDTYNSDVATSVEEYFYASEYGALKGKIVDSYRKTEALYNVIKNAKIQNYSILSDGVSKTVYDNGMTVLVNHNDYEVLVDGEALEPRSFKNN